MKLEGLGIRSRSPKPEFGVRRLWTECIYMCEWKRSDLLINDLTVLRSFWLFFPAHPLQLECSLEEDLKDEAFLGHWWPLIILSALTTTSASHHENEENSADEEKNDLNIIIPRGTGDATGRLEMKTDESDICQRPFILCGLTSWDRQQNVRRSVLSCFVRSQIVRQTLVES